MNDDELKEASNAFVKAINEIQEDQEKFWSSLSTEDQLKAFCCVVRRIYEGEIRNPSQV